LQINPQEISQDENFAVTVTPTQRGVIVEHQGSVLKDIVIGGTTGKHPKQKHQSIRDDGEPHGLGLAAGLSGALHSFTGGVIGEKNKKIETGYTQFHHLRNYFRAYVELKKDPTKDNFQLVFMNYKDNEFLKVEPLKFTMRRTSSKPFLYDYEITLKGIGRYEAPKVESNAIRDAVNFINEAADTVADVTAEVSNVVGFVKYVNQGVADIVLQPLARVSAAATVLNNATDEYREFINSPDDFFWNQINNEASRVKAQWGSTMENSLGTKTDEQRANERTDASGRVLEKVDSETAAKMQISREIRLMELESPDNVERVARQELTVSKLKNLQSDIKTVMDQFSEATGADTGEQLVDEEYQALNALKKAYIVMDGLVLNEKFFTQTIDSEIAGLSSYFSEPTFIPTPTSARGIIILGTDNIKSIAARELGSADRYKELIILNDLVPPYIIPASYPDEKRVLKRGESILIPEFSVPSIEVPFYWRTYEITKNLTAFERSLFVDVELTQDNDFAINNASDMSLVAARENALQSLRVRLGLEPGSLKLHTQVGFTGEVGVKNIANWELLRLAFEQTITMDPRFAGVDLRLKETETGSVTHVGCRAFLNQDKQGVPLYYIKELRG